MNRIITLIFSITLAIPASAGIRPNYEDGIVVERSELIVIAQLVPESLTQVDVKSGMRLSHARIKVTEILKGQVIEREIPVAIFTLSVAEQDKAINLYGGNGHRALDISKPSIWFLRKKLPYKEIKAAGLQHCYAIVDPQDVKPLADSDYIRCYLKPEPVQTLRTFVKYHPEYADRAISYFRHMEVRAIRTQPDIKTRIQLLIPYYEMRISSGNDEILQEFKQHPKEAADELLKLFRRLRPEIPDCKGVTGLGHAKWPLYCKQCHEAGLRKDIIRLLGENMRSPIAHEICREVLNNAHLYWDRIERDPESAITELSYQKENLQALPAPQDSIYYEAEYAIYHSSCAGLDRSLLPLIEKTKERWRTKDARDFRLSKACDFALNRLNPPASK